MNELERAKALFEEGIRRYSENDFLGAEQCFREAQGYAPGRISILSNLATALLRQDKFAEAEQWALQALAADAGNFEVLLCLGGCCEKTGRWEAALAHYRQALTIRPGAGEALSNLGGVLSHLKRHAEALACLDQALAAAPQMAEAWLNRGKALNDMGRCEEALQSFERALALRPNSIEAWYNRGNALADLARRAEAVQSYDKALTLAPMHADAHFNKGLALLDACEFAPGWKEYEWRWKSPTSGAIAHSIASQLPQWDGSTTSARLLSWAEQGVGDEILYAGMLPQLRARVAALVVLADRRLLPLLRRSFADIRFLPKDEPPPSGIADVQIAMGSLGRHLRTSLADFPAAASSSAAGGYLEADPARISRFKSALGGEAGGSRLCGIAWISKNPRYGDAKSMRLKDLLPVLKLPGMTCVDLQYGDTTAERAELLANEDITPHHLDNLDSFNDLDGLASLIAACDVIVTASNVTVHIAGALGKPTHLLAPFSRGKIWYWHQGHDLSLWYPSVRIHHQSADGCWDQAVAEVAGNP